MSAAVSPATWPGSPETTPLGDPGLLYTDRIRLPRARRHRWGIVSHFEDKRHPFIKELTEHDDTIAIDVCQEPRKVVSAINSCSHIFTTSLHGLIVADSLEIPACWGRPDAQSGTRDFKFNDYHTAYHTMASDQRRADLTRTINLRELEDLAASPDVDDVNRVKNDLRRSRKDLAKALVVRTGRTSTVRNVAREIGLTMWRGHARAEMTEIRVSAPALRKWHRNEVEQPTRGSVFFSGRTMPRCAGFTAPAPGRIAPRQGGPRVGHGGDRRTWDPSHYEPLNHNRTALPHFPEVIRAQRPAAREPEGLR